MSKARLVITAVVLEGRSQADVARAYNVSKGWVSKLVARYRTEGDAAFEPRSRRPHTSPNATPPATVELIIELRHQLTTAGLDAGPDTIHWHLQHDHHITVSVPTISRTLTRHQLVTPEPKKRPKSSYIRFQAEQPNETWQSDFTHYRLANGVDIEILTWLDDHSRYALSITAHRRVTATDVLTTFRQTCTSHGTPASTLTDNGMVFTTRFAGGRGGRNAFEAELVRLHIVQKNSRPNHPTTCGKVERFQQTMKKWIRAQPDQPATITELHTLLDLFADEYNHHRPHRSLPHRSTPATAYQTRPKASPGSRNDPHHRVRHDHVDNSGTVTLRHNGRLHHIGIGRTHARTPIILLIADLDIRIIHAATGEILRELTLDPTRDYQPTGAPKGPTRPRK
ncbi:MAG: transposase [Ilumatobacteraceae bacterium]|nr:transposase [Ilumatobacteraceae bacterium]